MIFRGTLLTCSPGWVQTNAPAIRKGEKVCVSARSLVVWNQLPLEVAYARIEKPRLPLWQKLGFPVNRELTAGDLSAPPSAEHGQPPPACQAASCDARWRTPALAAVHFAIAVAVRH